MSPNTTSHLMLYPFNCTQIKYMAEYLEREFGERALNGDKS